MIRVLFICHGNICRSAMAEYILKDMVRKAGREKDFRIESAATSTEEIGNPVYPPAKRELKRHGISCEGHSARQITRADYDRFDLLIGMDRWNIRNMERAFGGDPEGKIHLMSEYAHFSGEVGDPWYTGKFEEVYAQLADGCSGLLSKFTRALRFAQDYHIHTYLSSCSSDPEENPERILQYARENGLKEVCITDHLWDAAVPGASDWYRPQNIGHVREILPLPKDPEVQMHFGCETDMDKEFRLGLAEEHFDLFDFIIVPTTHLHMRGFTISEEDWGNLARRRALAVERVDRLLERNYPFRKMGLAHMTCTLAAGYENQWENHIRLFDEIPDAVYTDQFRKAASVGIGIELNAPVTQYNERELDKILRPYRIAKDCGCKFYYGSDAHHPKSFLQSQAEHDTWVKELGLTEADRFRPLW